MLLPKQLLSMCVCVLLGALAGCGRDADGRDAASRSLVRDSAGVEIVEFPGSLEDLPIAFRISETHRLDLGGSKDGRPEELDASAPFHDAVPLSDGRLVVTDMSGYKVFDAEGRYLFSMGRRGEGPGEFGQARSACVAPGDTIVTIHYTGSRVSVFDPSGEHVRTFRIQDGYPEGSGCFADGSILAISEIRPDPATPGYQVATGPRVAIDGSDLGRGNLRLRHHELRRAVHTEQRPVRRVRVCGGRFPPRDSRPSS
jgi:hypothetical protein